MFRRADSEGYRMFTFDEKSGREGFQYFSMTRSTCFECVKSNNQEIKLVDAEIFFKDGKTYLKKFCPEHGISYALKNSDTEWYMKSMQLENIRPGVSADVYQTEERLGCPFDCGLCPTHHQHTCVPVVDITGKCDMGCPVCDAQISKKSPYFMSMVEFKDILDMVIQTNRDVQALSFSGGEPSLHPLLPDFIAAALERDEIRRVDILTGGIRLSRDEKFVEMLAENNPYIYVNLSFDGFTSAPYEYIRGRNYVEMKLKALANLKKYEINTITQTIVARRKNEDQIGRIILELVHEPHIRGFIFQPLIWARGAPDSIVDPMDRVTLPDILRSFESQTDGLLCEDDFLFNPCPHPECQHMAYLWVGKRLKSMAQIIPKPELMKLAESEPLMRPERVAKILFDRSRFATSSETRNRDSLAEYEKKNKFVNLHHYMDAHDFDLSRLKKCCQHIASPPPEGRLRPVCAYNLFYRSKDARWI